MSGVASFECETLTLVSGSSGSSNLELRHRLLFDMAQPSLTSSALSICYNFEIKKPFGFRGVSGLGEKAVGLGLQLSSEVTASVERKCGKLMSIRT